MLLIIIIIIIIIIIVRAEVADSSEFLACKRGVYTNALIDFLTGTQAHPYFGDPLLMHIRFNLQRPNLVANTGGGWHVLKRANHAPHHN